MQRPISTEINNITRTSGKRKYRRYYVLLKFAKDISNTEMEKMLAVLETTAFATKGHNYRYFLKVRVKSFYILPDNQRVILSLAPAKGVRFNKQILLKQIDWVCSSV